MMNSQTDRTAGGGKPQSMSALQQQPQQQSLLSGPQPGSAHFGNMSASGPSSSSAQSLSSQQSNPPPTSQQQSTGFPGPPPGVHPITQPPQPTPESTPTTAPAQQQQVNQLPAQTLASQPATVWCRLGADYVQEIVARTVEMFQILKLASNSGYISNPALHEERKTKIREYTRHIEIYFKRLRAIYNKCNEIGAASLDLPPTGESLIPFKEDSDSDEENAQIDPSDTPQPDTRPSGTLYSLPKIDPERKRANPKLAALEQEHTELLELNQLKHRQLKDIIDRLRQLVWDINTMLAMRSN